MSGIVDPSYAVTNESLGLKNIQDRQYRGFKSDEAIVNSVRGQFITNKGKFFAIIEGFKADFDNPKSHQEVVEYIESFFTLIEDDKRYKSEIINQMRTK